MGFGGMEGQGVLTVRILKEGILRLCDVQEVTGQRLSLQSTLDK